MRSNEEPLLIDVALLEDVFEKLLRDERELGARALHPAFEDLFTWLGWHGASSN